MDVFEHGLDNNDKADDSQGSDDVQLTMEDNGDDPGSISLTLDANGQYQFRADTGQGSVTYRVVQLQQSDDGQHHLVTGLSNQAVLHGLSNGSSPSHESSTSQTRFAYIPAAVSSNIESSGQGLETIAAPTANVNTSGGPFYVMVSPQDVLQPGQRTIIPRSSIIVKQPGSARGSRDDRRRTTHNEVERRRRDKINNWIQQLGKLVPDCQAETKQGDSKGGILSKACDFIGELQVANKDMANSIKESEHVKMELDNLRQQYEELKQENDILRAHLQQNGLNDFQSASL